MEIRQIKSTEFEEIQQLRDYSFSSIYQGEKLKDFQYWLENSDTLGCFINQRLVGQILVLPLNLTLRGQNFEMGGIGFVATYPEYRNQGIMKKLMIYSLETMRKNKQSVSVLAPYSVSFYHYFGWALFNDVLRFDMTAAHFPRLGKAADHVERTGFLNLDDAIFAKVKNYHNEEISKQTGAMIRSDAWWSRIKARQPRANFAVVFDELQQVVGYIRYEIIETTFTIDDFFASTYQAETAIWRFVVAHEASIDRITGIRSATTKLGLTVAEPQYTQQLKQETMLRIVDVEAFFNQYMWQKADLSLYMNVSDTFAEWNNKVFHITATAVTIVDVNKEVVTEEIVEISINTLASLVSGYASISELRYLELLQMTDLTANQWDKAFPKERPFFNEYF